MNRLVNPFRYVAGVRALAAGLALIAAASCWLHALGLCQDSYLHFGPAPDGFTVWHVAALQIGMWLAPALALYGCGRALSPSRIRLVDVLGTTALAQAPILLLLVPLSIGPPRARRRSCSPGRSPRRARRPRSPPWGSGRWRPSRSSTPATTRPTPSRAT